MTNNMLLALALLLASPLALAQDVGAGDDLPAGVEPGSTQVVVTVKEGETLDDIAMKNGFLRRDLVAWNGLEEGAGLAPGQQIVLWVAPLETPAGEEEKPKEPRVASGSDRSGLSPFVGLQFGPAFSFNDLQTSVLPRLELGAELPVLDRRLRVFLAVAYMRPIAEGSGSHVGLNGEIWDYTLKQSELTIALGPTLRITDVPGPVVPEVSLAPQLYLLRSAIDGNAQGSAFGENIETYSRIGVYAAIGAAMELGPGELTLHVSLASSALGEVITGEANTAAVAPVLGYRMIF